MNKSYADVLESYIIAEEGTGTNILKVTGKVIWKLIKPVLIFLGITVGISSLAIAYTVRYEKTAKKRLENMTPEEKLSRKNYLDNWVPKIQEFQKSVIKDIEKFDKQYDFKKFLDVDPVMPDAPSKEHGYGCYILSLNPSELYGDDYDGDSPADVNKSREFNDKVKQLKPLIQKWKSEARKFSPYFELIVEDDFQNSDEYPDINICLSCKWVDKYGIIKPGLPENV